VTIRLFVDQELEEGKECLLNREQAHYLKNVMRLREGDALEVFNGRAGVFLATWARSALRIGAKCEVFRVSPPKALAFSLFQSQRMSWMIEKATELGVTHLFPLISERSSCRAFNDERYRRVVIEAAEQCRRMDLPEFGAVLSLEKFVKALPSQFHWCYGSLLALSGAALPGAHVNGYGYIIGPEGGFSSTEEALLALHATPISMGANVLRAETAGVWCCAQ